MTAPTPKQLVRYTMPGGEWSALYVDCVLDTCGDHYVIDNRISELAGVTEIDSDDFLQGTSDNVAATLNDIADYQARRHLQRIADEADPIRQAEQLEAQARALRAQAAFR